MFKRILKLIMEMDILEEISSKKNSMKNKIK